MFPSHHSLTTFPFPHSLPEAVSGACDSPESPPLLSLCIPFPPSPFPLFPARFSLPSFPARSSQWRLWLTRVPSTAKSVRSLPSFSPPTVPCPLSQFLIMFPPPFPIFDYVPALFLHFRLCSCSPFISDGIMLLIQIVEITIYVLSVKWTEQTIVYAQIVSQLLHSFPMQKSV